MEFVLEMLSNGKRTDITGNRLWVRRTEKQPGFISEKASYITIDNMAYDYLYKINASIDGVPCDFECVNLRWKPTGLEMEFQNAALEMKEKKFIDRNDRFISVLDIRNKSASDLNVELEIDTLYKVLENHRSATANPFFIRWDNKGQDHVFFELDVECNARKVFRQVIRTEVCIYSKGFQVQEDNCTLKRDLTLGRYQEARVVVAGYMDHTGKMSPDSLRSYTDNEQDIQSSYDKYFVQWFTDNVPQFICSSKDTEKLYYYRWYLVYRNLIYPETDCFQQACFYEGKDIISVPCSCSIPMQMDESRWLRDKRFSQGHAANLLESQIRRGIEKGRFRDTYISYFPSAVWNMYLVQKDPVIIDEYIDRIADFVEWESGELFVHEGDVLPVVSGTWRTAMEYQPSFFEFTEPRWDHTKSAPFGKERETALKRVDEAVFLYLNLEAVYKMLTLKNRHHEAEKYKFKLSQLKDKILSGMWDEESRFFYDLEPKSETKALLSRSIVGFFPGMTDILQDDHMAMYDYLSDPEEFYAEYPIPTVSAKCPAYAPDNVWRIGPHASADNPYRYACCWNGPSWHFSNSFVLESLGNSIHTFVKARKYQKLFRDIWDKWTQSQIMDRENNIINTCENMNPETGVWNKEVYDYFHSYYNNILISGIIGLIPEESEILRISPLDMGWEFFLMENIPYHGKLITVSWRKRGCQKNNSIDEGMTVKVNGKLAARADDLKDIVIDLNSQ